MNRFLPLCAAALLARPAAAQIDYRNLDDDRPLRVEDAYPVERYAFELIAPFHLSHEGRSRGHYLFTPELTYGFAAGAHAGIKLPLAGSYSPDGSDFGLAGVRGFVFVNLRNETPGLPALAVRLDGGLPAGGALAGDGGSAAIQLLATRSFGRNRLHLNGAWGFLVQDLPGAAEPTPRWWAGAAVDRTLIRSSTLLLAGVVVRDGLEEPRVAVELSAGLRRQLTPTLVVDAGVTRAVRGDGPAIGVTLGFTHAFAIPALYPGAPR